MELAGSDALPPSSPRELILALVVDGLARFLPIPKSLPMDKFFHDASQRLHDGRLRHHSGAAAGRDVLSRTAVSAAGQDVWRSDAACCLRQRPSPRIHGAQLGYAWAPVLSIFVVGVVFTVVRARTNSVAASFLMHCGYNFALFAVLWVASDHYRHLEKVAG